MSILDTHDQINVAADGNCFYRAVSLALYGTESRHTTLRADTMTALLSKQTDYGILFETLKRFVRCVHANKRDGIWNTEISDLAPSAAADHLGIHLIVYNKNIFTDKIDPPAEFNVGASATVRLLRVANCHYNLLKEKVVSSTPTEGGAPVDSDASSEIAVEDSNEERI